MRMEEFKKYLESLESIETQIVYLKYKYSWEENWTYSNEILEVDMNTDGYYVWASDWNEGQEDIEILGCIALYDIYVPKFPENTEVNRKSDLISRQDVPDINVGDMISRQDAITVCNSAIDLWEGQLGVGALVAVRDKIAELTINPERKKGKWIHDNPNTFRCSECNKYLDISCGNMKMNFCPNCGADMRGEQDDYR